MKRILLHLLGQTLLAAVIYKNLSVKRVDIHCDLQGKIYVSQPEDSVRAVEDDKLGKLN